MQELGKKLVLAQAQEREAVKTNDQADDPKGGKLRIFRHQNFVKIQSQVCLGFLLNHKEMMHKCLDKKGKSAGTSTLPLENPVLAIPGFSHPHKPQEQSLHS